MSKREKERWVAPKSNGYSYEALTVSRLRDVARLILSEFEGFDGKLSVLPEEAMPALIAVGKMLNAQPLLPRIECWCVVKHYASETKDMWHPAVWAGFTTKGQAHLFAKAIEAHYAAEAKRKGWGIDKFFCERGQVSLNNIINPKLTAAEYVKDIAR